MKASFLRDSVKVAKDILQDVDNFTLKGTDFLRCKKIKAINDYQSLVTVKTEAVVAVNDQNEFYVIFQGSWSFSDLLLNLQFWKSKLPSDIFKDPYGSKVHAGFLKHFLNIYENIETQIALYEQLFGKAKKVVLAGHSLGGALAELVGIYLKENGYSDRVCIVSFGVSKVGNNDYRNYINYRIDKKDVNRFVLKNDYVPLLPPFGYKHSYPCRCLGHKRKFPYISIKDHSIFSYYDYVSSLSVAQLNEELRC